MLRLSWPFPGGEYPAGFAGNELRSAKNLIGLRATGTRSPARAIRIGGVGVRERDTPAFGPWDPASMPTQPARSR